MLELDSTAKKDFNMDFDKIEELSNYPHDGYGDAASKEPFCKLNHCYSFLDIPYGSFDYCSRKANHEDINKFNSIKEKAGNDDKYAQFLLGWHYEHGIQDDLSNVVGDKKPDYKSAIEWYKKSYENGFCLASHQVGVIYDILGTELYEEGDINKAHEVFDLAIKWYKKEIKCEQTFIRDREVNPSHKFRCRRIKSSYLNLSRIYFENLGDLDGLGFEHYASKALDLIKKYEEVAYCFGDFGMLEEDPESSMLPFFVYSMYYREYLSCIEVEYGKNYLFSEEYKRKRRVFWLEKSASNGGISAVMLLAEEYVDKLGWYSNGDKNLQLYLTQSIHWVEKIDLLKLENLSELIGIVNIYSSSSSMHNLVGTITKHTKDELLNDEQIAKLKGLQDKYLNSTGND